MCSLVRVNGDGGRLCVSNGEGGGRHERPGVSGTVSGVSKALSRGWRDCRSGGNWRGLAGVGGWRWVAGGKVTLR